MGFVSITTKVYSKFDKLEVEVKSIRNIFEYLTDHDFKLGHFNIFIRKRMLSKLR